MKHDTIIKEFDEKFPVQEHYLEESVKSQMKAFLLKSLKSQQEEHEKEKEEIKEDCDAAMTRHDEEAVKMIEGMKYEEQHLGSPNIKPTEMFERGFNSAIIQIINKLK